jgi:hypothetical protein
MITTSSVVTGPKARLGARYMNIGDGANIRTRTYGC